MTRKYIVITSIYGVTEAVRAFAALRDWRVILVGDKKTPDIGTHANVDYLCIERQAGLDLATHATLPYNHYARKNLGYLYAMDAGARWIGESDDDNVPCEGWGSVVNTDMASVDVVVAPAIANVYTAFTDDHIWPRGLPLSSVVGGQRLEIERGSKKPIGVWQGLADGDPDVDAIYRLVNGAPTSFRQRQPVALGDGVMCPFNSQNTIWAPETYPWLYLPHSVAFRFTDILRGYVAQRGLQCSGQRLAFTAASVYQDRNEHDLMADFRDEIACYTQIDRVIEVLRDLSLPSSPTAGLLTMYGALEAEGIVSRTELQTAEAWAADVERLVPACVSAPTESAERRAYE